MLFKGPQARRYTQKVVHTQGRTHKRRPVATAGVTTTWVPLIMVWLNPCNEAAPWVSKEAVPYPGLRFDPRGGAFLKEQQPTL